jgi:DNA-binding MarR family transcriptional regulator
LRKKGLISQTRVAEDKRRQMIEITAAGDQIIQDNLERASAIVLEFQETLGIEKYEQLLDLLALLDPENPDT